MATWNNDQWQMNFYMSRGTFMEICTELASSNQWQTKMRAPLSVEKHTAITIWKLITPNSLQSIANFILPKLAEKGEFATGVPIKVEGVTVTPLLVGDPAYALHP